MKLIKLTSLNDKKHIYINVDMIGHIYEVEVEINNRNSITQPHTVVGSLTHNNGGFRVVESVEKILKLIEE
jgi:hypothetical protein